jgi:hypothetical protein
LENDIIPLLVKNEAYSIIISPPFPAFARRGCPFPHQGGRDFEE